ncbi:Clathrin light chain [Caenorhabditis elegans]|uniref:Clathrin light chain n=2 Tax=Caenorhabditis elegans TaxID=6239 RepID=B2FDA5_CAEEL|nr:Clathrin light chain [Caenorhabditis elegans]CAQ48408.1 Clathrin light chain [Caenorhabditis elegans]|eukprot:NP_499590.2 Uncharacterized protein CELE_Y75B8A.18 [Caenorhabditis elegans]
MSDFVVLGEPTTNNLSPEVGCQTEEIAVENMTTQTAEESITKYRKNTENPEMSYWESIVANRQNEVDRIKALNEKMEVEKSRKSEMLDAKQTEYTRLFDLGNEKLKKSSENGDSEEEPDTSTCK